MLIKALDIGMEELSTDVTAMDGGAGRNAGAISTHSAETLETSAQKVTRSMKRADALAVVAESFLQHGAEAMSGGDKHQIVVHVSKEMLSSDRAEPVEAILDHCEFEDGPAIAAETCRRLACDCSLVHVTEDEEGDPLNVGRKTRSVPSALKRALNARDKGCRFPGCCNKRYTHGHHVTHWANGGETKIGNLITLCYF